MLLLSTLYKALKVWCLLHYWSAIERDFWIYPKTTLLLDEHLLISTPGHLYSRSLSLTLKECVLKQDALSLPGSYSLFKDVDENLLVRHATFDHIKTWSVFLSSSFLRNFRLSSSREEETLIRVFLRQEVFRKNFEAQNFDFEKWLPLNNEINLLISA